MTSKAITLAVLVTVLTPPALRAGAPGGVGWRLDGTGRYPDADPPTEWAGPTTTQPDGLNLRWTAAMPDWSNASPVLAGGRLFVNSEKFTLLCADAETGRVLWTRSHAYEDVMTDADRAQQKVDDARAAEVRGRMAPVQQGLREVRDELAAIQRATTQPDAPADALDARRVAAQTRGAELNAKLAELNAELAPLLAWRLPGTNETNGYSSPTPASDGRSVYVLYGNGVAASYDLDGNRRWARWVARTPVGDGVAGSPVLADGKLLVHVADLTALDPATGRTLWTARDTAPIYGTPAVGPVGDVPVAVTANGDVVRLSDGAVLARRISNVSYCSPILQGGVAYFIQNISRGHGGGHAVRLTLDGDRLATELLWQTTPARDRYYASPVLHEGLIYAVNQANAFSVIDAADGSVVFTGILDLGKGTTYPSICLAGGRLFVSSDTGTTAVLTPGRTPRMLATNRLDPFRGTPLFVGERVYIRGLKNLYCIAEGGARAGAPAAAGQGELRTGRPRLFIRPDEWAGGLSLDQLRRRARTDPFKDRVRLLRTTRANLALKWLMTGDEAAAAEALARLKKFSTRLDTSSEGSELIDAALAYDWLFAWEGFTDADKKRVEDDMLELAGQMVASLSGGHGHVFHTRMYAWASAAGMAGLALHDRRAGGRELFRFACEYYRTRLLPARRLQGGAMHNGLSYGPNHMMFPLLQFLLAARSAADVDFFHTAEPSDSDWLREVPYFLIHAIQPDMRHVQYADVSTTDPAKHFRFMLDIFAKEYRNGHAAAMADRISERFKTTGYHAEWIYLFFTQHDPTVAPAPLDELLRFRVFSPRGVGHAFWRNDWGENATMVHFRCGDYFEDHGHFDQGSLTVFRRGGLAIKSGGYWGFDSDHRHHYYKQAISSNTVIFNDPLDPADAGRQRNVRYQQASTFEDYLAHKQPGASPRLETGEIVAVNDPDWVERAGDVNHVAADVTAAWDPAKVRRFVRQVAVVDGKHVVVVDDTETTRPDIGARWLLHTQVEPKCEGGAWAARLDESVLFVQPLLPADAKVTLIGGTGRECEVNGENYTYTDTERYRRYHGNRTDLAPAARFGLWRMEIEGARPAARRLFVTVLTADAPDAAPPVASARLDGGRLVVRVGASVVRFARLGG